MTSPESSESVVVRSNGVTVGLALPSGAERMEPEGVRGGRDAWRLPGGVAVICEVLRFDADDPQLVMRGVGTLVHEYRQRAGAVVTGSIRLPVDGAGDAVEYTLLVDRDNGVFEHRVVAGARPTGVSARLVTVQISWQSMSGEIAPESAAGAAAILESWSVGPAAG